MKKKVKNSNSAVAPRPRDPQLCWLYDNILPKVSENISEESALALAIEIARNNIKMHWRLSAIRLSKYIPQNDRRQHSLIEIADQEITAKNLIENGGQHVTDQFNSDENEADPSAWFNKHAVPYLKAGLNLESTIKTVSAKILRKFKSQVSDENFWQNFSGTEKGLLNKIKEATLNLTQAQS